MTIDRLMSVIAFFALTLPASAATIAPGDTLAAKQDFSLAVIDEFKTLDPQRNSDSDSTTVLLQLFETLYAQEPDGTLVPAAALGYDLSQDKLTYTFHLRPGARWSNGEPVTAKDFVYAWRRLVDPKLASSYAWYLATMKVKNAQAVIDGKVAPSELGVAALDDLTFQVVLSEPVAYVIPMVTHTSTLPVPAAAVEANGEAWTQPGKLVSNGAYVLKDNEMGRKLVMGRNDKYWDNAHTIIDTVTFHIINDENQQLTRYLGGDLDVSLTPAGQFPRLKKDYPDQAFVKPAACTYGYLFNLGEKGLPALKDVRVRKALSYAVNRDVITDNILQGGQKPAYGWTHWAVAGFKAPAIDYGQWTQAERLAKAKQLLTEAGFGPNNPLKITILYNTSEGHKKVAVAAQQFWKAIGVTATIENVEWKVLTDRLEKGDYDIGRYGWCADYDEASSFLNYFVSGGKSDGKFSNADYDRIMAESATAADPTVNYAKAEQILAEEMPIIPIYFYTKDGLVKPDIRGYPVRNVLDNWYAKNLYRVAK